MCKLDVSMEIKIISLSLSLTTRRNKWVKFLVENCKCRYTPMLSPWAAFVFDIH